MKKTAAKKSFEFKLEVISDGVVDVSVFTVHLDQNMILEYYIEMIEFCGNDFIAYIDGVPFKWSMGAL